MTASTPRRREKGHLMQQAIIASALILTYVLITQYGRRRFAWHKWLPPLLGIPVIGVIYLRTAPMTLADLVVYAAAIGIGAVFGVLATRTTRLERDPRTRRLYTRCGVAFALTWLVALGSRVAFVWALQDSTAVRQDVGDFMRDHQIVRDAIAPTFVLIALSMFMLRLAVLGVQARMLTVKASGQPVETVPPGRDRTISSR